MSKERTEDAGTSEPPASVNHFGVLFAYNGSDHESVIAIYDELKRRGIEPWIDSRNHRPGKDWRRGFTDAIKNTPVAIVFCGPNGTGKWQDEEIPSIHTQCVAHDVHVIPVILPGGTIPDDMLFATRSSVAFVAGPKDRDALDKLEFGITGRNPRDRRGRFEILAPVVRTELNCFLAVSHATSREIYDVLLKAALDAGLIVNQPREFKPDAHNVYTPDVVIAIRSATVILADGTPHSVTNKPDADVMYEIGLAEAFAKPLIFVTKPQKSALPLPIFVCDGTCSPIEYSPTEVDYSIRLQEMLANRLRAILKGMRPPHIVLDNDLGIHVAYSEMFQHRVDFWQPFEQIMHYGLAIKRAFAEILKHVHKMQQIIEQAHADAVAVKDISTLRAALRQFREVYEQFCKPHMKDLELAKSWKDAKDEATNGFDVLKEIAADAEDSKRSLQTIVLKSRQFFEILNSYLEEYWRAHDAVLTWIDSPSANTLHQVIHLRSGVQRLGQSAELVPANACEMMFQLLEMIGMRSELGGSSNATDDT